MALARLGGIFSFLLFLSSFSLSLSLSLSLFFFFLSVPFFPSLPSLLLLSLSSLSVPPLPLAVAPASAYLLLERHFTRLLHRLPTYHKHVTYYTHATNTTTTSSPNSPSSNIKLQSPLQQRCSQQPTKCATLR